MPRCPRWRPYTHSTIPWSTSTAQQLMSLWVMLVQTVLFYTGRVSWWEPTSTSGWSRSKGLQGEMKRLKAELEESRIEAERFRASQASMSGQRSALTRPSVQLLHIKSALTAIGALSGQRDNLWRRSSGCQPASALAPDSACVCLAGRGATFAAEVSRRVALRTLERRPLPCGHHRWSRPALSAGTSHTLHISGRDTGGG
ncbi:uncharacterized protein LOC112249168 isoform X2 [Oncorhynchus tshawytscha]|uniref:uncharacterized protein LOC112249168 isoform X2 n=1 Tax=Oncorhynchus tshawytscha TaxID=74940 RepID=UPI000D0A89D7|nr:uncharacterized protein LOC112249168 isoform X2 [Oncorhynchus tshawytscha]